MAAEGPVPMNHSPALSRAERLLKTTPLIDGHNDFPFLLRQQLHNQIYSHDLSDNLTCHTSIAKMRKGMMGGQFWSIYVPNPEELRLVPLEDDDGTTAIGGSHANGTNGVHVCGCEHIEPAVSKSKKGLGLNEPNVGPTRLYPCLCIILAEFLSQHHVALIHLLPPRPMQTC